MKDLSNIEIINKIFRSILMRLKSKKLLLCANDKHGKEADFEQIKDELKVLMPELKVYIISEKLNFFQRIIYCGSVVISMIPLSGKPPFFSKVFSGIAMSKAEECQRLDEHHLPTPRWYFWERNTELPNIDDWGEYVVRKPNRGARGAEVKIVKRNRLVWKMLNVKYRNISSEPFLQEFIYTGPYPVSYRVGVFFGEPIYSFKIAAPTDSAPLKRRFGFNDHPQHGISKIVANTKQSCYTFCSDEDIIELARSVHTAFPEIPLLGVDIIRDFETGSLWVIEVNASGYVWHLTSEAGQAVEKKHGISIEKQFGGLRRATEILAERLNSF